MKKLLQITTLTFGLILLSYLTQAQTVPELVYYKFNGTGSTVPNEASTPVGTNPAPVSTLTQGGTGQLEALLMVLHPMEV